LTTVHEKEEEAMNEVASKALFDLEAIGLSERLLAVRSWKMYNKEFPVLDVGFGSDSRAEFRVRLIAANWNDEPPIVELLTSTGEFLTKLPRHPGSVFNDSRHPATGRPFVCMAGAREYHTHPSHLYDSWDNYRRQDRYKLGGILTQLWNAWLKSAP
jgi:hypothetical protein